MSLALDASTPAFKTGATNPATTAAFSPPASAALFALCQADTSNTFAVSGGGLTWSQIASRNAGGSEGSVAVFFAWNASAQTNITVSSTKTGSFTANALKVLVFTGAESTYGGATANTGTATASVTTTAANSWVWANCIEENGNTNQTAASGDTINDAFTAYGGISGGVIKTTSTTATSGTVVACGVGSNFGVPSTIVFEVRAASGGGGGLSSLLIPPPPRARLIRASCF